ncbi:hypothetical protein PPYR_01345 [Photinus pyralis]|uniref:SAM domain-containing protein n=1 Tax=Photinus pyralis TaxID=7054 RepID=A0A5N4B454_PHOPY|nr:uncharacterized protein LOC116159711 isoform X3 [Photinus pyralis]KAB0804375.1 hypothetical protein PPYR_01345 [Photinus pyralis]
MEKLLCEWGFPDLVAVFAEQDIDEDALLCLDFDSLKELIPKIGPRVKFSNRLKQYQNVINTPFLEDIENNMPSTSLPVAEDSASNPNEIIEFILSPSASTSSCSTSASYGALQDATNVIGEAFQAATKRKMAFCGEENLKKACRNVYNLDVEAFLDKTVSGRYILNTYRKEKRLTRNMRSKLSHILISGLMSQDSESGLIPIDFEILSEKICNIFPTETKATYYIARVPGNKLKKPINAKGKLIDMYRNLRRVYLPKISLSDSDGTSTDNTLIEDISNKDELHDCAVWLKSFQEPWDLVLHNWKTTFPLRKIKNTIPTVEQYMIEWPILKHKNAFTLIQFDFHELFPNCPIHSLLNEYQKWEKFFIKLKNIHTLDKATEEFVDPLSSEISQDSKNAIQIAALAMIFPPKGRIRCKKTHWKPSILECQESLINLVSTCGSIEECIVKRRNKLSELNLTVQPYMIVVGASYSCITESYVIIDTNVYKTCSVLHAFDFLFKAFHSLNANYPKECEHIWLVVERILYNLESSAIQSPAVLTLLKELEPDV